ncbi:hypothetical protein [Sphingomonas profundi]|uniref:hypothetical protein n=1 Tax=Alterirhizorhabdus profundi TaxID=2681549 RepID=UPI0012E90EFA|nr:hypothetical protein [Sphingomonas profundi]
MADIWNRALAVIQSEPRRPREPIRIPDGHVRPQAPAPQPPIAADDADIVAKRDYVMVRLNQLFLADQRRWFTEIEPSVFASTEFLYDGKARTVPVVVGPSPKEGLPSGTVLKNMMLFGPHPYRGGPFTFTFVLNQMPTHNVARDVVEVVESASAALAPGLGLEVYTRIGGIVLDGFDRIMGLNGVKPLIGLRQTIDPDSGDAFPTGRWALIDSDDAPDPDEFWVIDDVLRKGPTAEAALPYREADFMLYQIARVPPPGRRDLDALPFHPLWIAALAAAAKSSAGAWDEAKANLAAMFSAVAVSPDLTWTQGRALMAERLEQLRAVHDDAMRLAVANDAAAPGTAVQDSISDLLRLP